MRQGRQQRDPHSGLKFGEEARDTVEFGSHLTSFFSSRFGVTEHGSSLAFWEERRGFKIQTPVLYKFGEERLSFSSLAVIRSEFHVLSFVLSFEERSE